MARTWRLLLVCLVTSFAMSPAWAAQAIKIGSIDLQPNLRQDALDLRTASAGQVTLRLLAVKGDVVIKRVTLLLKNGTVVGETRTINLGQGERTRPLALGVVDANGSRINIEYEIAGKASTTLEVLAEPYLGSVAIDKSTKGWRARPHSVDQPPQPPPPVDEPAGQLESQGGSASASCVSEAVCTPVPVFFGTNRAKTGAPPDLGFTQQRSEELTLGKLIVTVPRAYRKRGEIPRPSWSDVIHLRNPWKEDPSRHFVLVKSLTEVYADADAYVDAVRRNMAEAGDTGQHVFIFIHGFNTSFEFAAFRAAQISYDMGDGDKAFGTAMLFSWPSAGETQDYVYDLDSSRLATGSLKAYVKLVTERLQPSHVHLIAHSMGNWPLLLALDELAKEGSSGPAKIDSVILAAPDVDAAEFQKLATSSMKIGKNFTLYASSTDRAMVASKKLRRDMPRAGDVTSAGPVVVDGLDSLDISSVSTAIFSLNHSDYADKKELLNDMFALMSTGQRPPNIRNPAFHVQGIAPTLFWRFTQ